jgi:pyrroline-5-carboxylate reductase
MATAKERRQRIGIVGTGNLASALIQGLLGTGHVAKAELMLSDADPAKLESARTRFDVRTSLSNGEVTRFADVVVFAVKPQHLPHVLDECAADLGAQKLVISVAAGVRIASIAARLPAGTRIVRAMPNTAALAGQSATALAAGATATADDLTFARGLFDAVGKSVVLDEPHLDAVTGLSGSGPAYVMVMIEALADGGVRMGLPRDVAQTLATQTLLGAAQLLFESGEHPAVWKDRVTSPGGTTAAGLKALEAGGVRHALSQAVEQATLRARELGRAADERS